MTIELNKIYNMDCFDYLEQVPDDYFDFVFTDHPYEMTKNTWDKKVDLAKWWKEIHRVTKENTAVISFAAQPFTTELINSNIKNFRYSLIWDKVLPVGFLNANKMPLRSHEDICVFYKKLPFYNPEKTQGHDRKIIKNRKSTTNYNYGFYKSGTSYDSTERYPKSILCFSNGGNRTNLFHQTEKPLDLAIYLLKLYAKKGFRVLDTFVGGGTIPVACKSLGLDFGGCDLLAKNVSIANKRLNAVQGILL